MLASTQPTHPSGLELWGLCSPSPNVVLLASLVSSDSAGRAECAGWGGWGGGGAWRWGDLLRRFSGRSTTTCSSVHADQMIDALCSSLCHEQWQAPTERFPGIVMMLCALQT